jgi:hypothetical protein
VDRQHVRHILVAAILVAAIPLSLAVNRTPPRATASSTPAVHAFTAAERAATFTYDASALAGHRALIADAIAAARPEAQRLIAIVDGITTLRVGPAAAGALGVTQPLPDGGYAITLDLAETYRTLGQRGVTRLVLHELGHVVDDALLSPGLRTTLDHGIPPGLPCPAGTRIGSCAPTYERFAESFAKWAMNDAGYDLYIGYGVPVPPDLDAWAAPLLGLGT